MNAVAAGETVAAASEAPSVEEDLFTLSAIAPELLEEIPALFGETVKESLAYVLGPSASKGVIEWLRSDELQSRQGVFARLAALYGERATPIEALIDRVFGLQVRALVQRLP